MSLFKSKDEKNVESIQEKILENLQKTGGQIENLCVECEDDTVKLSGVCDTPKSKKKAILIADITEGIKHVNTDALVISDAYTPEDEEESEESAATAPKPQTVPSQEASPTPAAPPTEPTRQVSPTAAPQLQFYTVQKGDSLSKIAQKFYGNGNKYMLIFEANKDIIKDPNLIHPGQKIQIPPLKE